MVSTLTPHRLAISALALLMLSHPVEINAQTTSGMEEAIALRPGGILEVYADTITPDPQISWVFSKGRTFVQAERGPLFSARPTDASEYFLTGEVADSHGAPKRKVFRIQVSQDSPLISQSGKDGSTLVHIFPPPGENGVTVLRGEQRIVRLDIVHPDIEQLALDIDSEQDHNNDGDPFNDNILGNSIFQAGRGSLYIWLTPSMQNQKFLFAARLKNGALVTQQVQVISESYEEELQQQIEMEEQQRKDRTIIASKLIGEQKYKLSVVAEPGVISGPILYHWDFGDGTQSLMDEPEHKFPETRTYSVHVVARDARTGEEIVKADLSIAVAETADQGLMVDTTGEEDINPETVQETAKKTGSIVATVVKALIILAVSVAVGILAVFIFAKMKGKSLQESFEEAENKLVGPPVDASAEPMKIEKTEEEESEAKKKEEEKKEGSTPETPDINRQVPNWLAPSPQVDDKSDKSEDASQKDTSLPPPPPPPPTISKDTVPPVQQTAAQDKVTASAPSEEAAKPPWLQGQAAEPTTTTETTPKEAPTTESPPPAKEPAPAKEESTTPPWLAGVQTPKEPETGTPAVPPQKTTTAEPAKEPPPKEATPPTPQADATSTPPWLQGAGTDTKETPPPPPHPAKEPAPSATPVPPTGQTSTTPPWLQGSETSTPPAPETTPETQGEAAKTSGSGAPPPPPPPPPPPTTGQSGGQQTGDDQTTTKEERERERKRRKRQRYRENKRAREQEGKQTTAQPAAMPTETPTQPEQAAQTPPPLQQAPATTTQAPPATPVQEPTATPPAPPPPAPPAQDNSSVPPWLQGTQTTNTQTQPAPDTPPKETPPPAAPPPPPPPTASPPQPQGDAPVPDWLKGTSSPAAPPPPAQEPPKQTGDDDVKFVISADSVEEQTPPPPATEGEIPPEEKHEE